MSNAGEIAVSQSLLFSAVISRLIRRCLTCTAMKKHWLNARTGGFYGVSSYPRYCHRCRMAAFLHYMGFNYAAEKKKFETLWARLRREYRAAGMSDAAIQKMHDFDWEVFKQERIYRLHTQDLGIGIFYEPSAEQEDKSALMKKFLESVSRWDDYTTASRYGWIEGIGDQRLVRVLKRLSISEKELLTKYCWQRQCV